jgi:hypothetical protein
MNKTVHIFLCTLLATSPILAVNTDKQPKESFIKRHWKLAAASVSGTIAGFSFLNTAGAMIAQHEIYAECMKKNSTLDFNVPDALAESLINIDKAKLLADKYAAPLMFWMTACVFSTIAAVMLYDSWKTSTTNSTEEQKPDNEVPAHE